MEPEKTCCKRWNPTFMIELKHNSERSFLEQLESRGHSVPDKFHPISPIIILSSDPDEPASEVEVEVHNQSDPDWVKLVLENVLNDAAHSLLQLQTRKATKHMLDIIKQSGERAARILTGFTAVRNHSMKTPVKTHPMKTRGGR